MTLFKLAKELSRRLVSTFLNGAEVADLYMSLIHSCELNAANSLDYLTELLRHTEQPAAKPSDWLP